MPPPIIPSPRIATRGFVIGPFQSFDNFKLLQRGLVDGQAQAWNILIKINESIFGSGPATKDVPEQLVANFYINHGQYSAMGEFRLAITAW
jgi:hypothetical protein